MSAGPGAQRPTRDDLVRAVNKRVPDVIAPNLRVLFVGINPGLYSAAVGHHFARPGNRFWPTLHRAGFTPRVFLPFEERELLKLGIGVTNIVPRATARAEELSNGELTAGGKRLAAKIRKYRPQTVAVVGLSAFRIAFGEPKAKVGLQARTLENAVLWLLPNPSGLNANYQAAALAQAFGELRQSCSRTDLK